jgi:hypothetical protein
VPVEVNVGLVWQVFGENKARFLEGTKAAAEAVNVNTAKIALALVNFMVKLAHRYLKVRYANRWKM